MKNVRKNLRIYIVLSLLALTFFAILTKIAYLQVFNKEFFKNLAYSQYIAVVSLKGERGKIYDREGRILAMDLTTYSVYADPQLVEDKDKFCKEVAEVLEIDREKIKKKLYSPKRFVWIKRKISWEEKEKVEKLKLKGLGFIREKKRFYPHGSLAAHILGGVDLDNRGIEGIEFFYERYLQGKEGITTVFKDSSASTFTFHPQVFHPQKGADIFLTIEAQIQYWSESYLKETIEKFKAKAGSVIVMDASNGELLALANWPTFDPNRIGEFVPSQVRNRAITDIFEPGSVFKIVTLVTAIAERKFSPQRVIFCERGKYKIPGSILHDWKPYGELTFKEVFKKSSNIGVAKIAQSLPPFSLYTYMKKLSFGRKTDIDLPGETSGILKSPQKWSKTSYFIIPIGQEVGVSLIQLASAMATIANGGYKVRPHLVRKIWHGESFWEFKPHKKRVLPSKVAENVREVLKEVVEEGTGKLARIDGAVVGGKTGTAQKFDVEKKRYSHTRYRASFVGFIQKDSHPLVIAVSIDEPVKSHFGGVVAASLFKKIGESILKYREYKAMVEKKGEVSLMEKM